jgi:hypothetical protein
LQKKKKKTPLEIATFFLLFSMRSLSLFPLLYSRHTSIFAVGLVSNLAGSIKTNRKSGNNFEERKFMCVPGAAPTYTTRRQWGIKYNLGKKEEGEGRGYKREQRA